MKREVKEGAEFITYDAHKGFHVCRINQAVREDSVGMRAGLKSRMARGREGQARRRGRGRLELSGVHVHWSPEALVNPESCDAGLGIMEVLVGSQHALEHLGEEQ